MSTSLANHAAVLNFILSNSGELYEYSFSSYRIGSRKVLLATGCFSLDTCRTLNVFYFC